EILGVERHTIKRWENDGCIRFEVRKAGRAKFTTGRQIIKCWETTYL
ncbi:MAG: MerR family transcriptional regulator, partial [Clostridia bacterium]|nr:MerR family transcriptional regulator [Clostridia bacterium]